MTSKRCEHPGCTLTVYRQHAYCANHDTTRKRRTRVRENQVANFLRDRGLPWSAWNKQLAETGCGAYRPDFCYERPTHVVIVECDENQHAQPGYSCDNKRMLDIFSAYGGTPVVFIRWNPDAFTLQGARARRSVPARLHALERQLRAALAVVPERALSIHRMFYDRPDNRLVASTYVCPDDITFTEHDL
jgi:hypothetical protein